MKRETREEAIDRANRNARSADLWRLVAIDALQQRYYTAREHWEDNGRYTATLYRAEHPTGGYVVIEHACNGQLTHYDVAYLDDWAGGIPGWAHDARDAARRLRHARDNAVTMA